jgi:hypothetical protein
MSLLTPTEVFLFWMRKEKSLWYMELWDNGKGVTTRKPRGGGGGWRGMPDRNEQLLSHPNVNMVQNHVFTSCAFVLCKILHPKYRKVCACVSITTLILAGTCPYIPLLQICLAVWMWDVPPYRALRQFHVFCKLMTTDEYKLLAERKLSEKN